MTHPKPPPVTPKQTVTLKVPVHRVREWKQYAAKHGVSVSRLIRFAVDRHLLMVAEQKPLQENTDA